jgi:hypothetical protein
MCVEVVAQDRVRVSVPENDQDCEQIIGRDRELTELADGEMLDGDVNVQAGDEATLQRLVLDESPTDGTLNCRSLRVS